MGDVPIYHDECSHGFAEKILVRDFGCTTSSFGCYLKRAVDDFRFLIISSVDSTMKQWATQGQLAKRCDAVRTNKHEIMDEHGVNG